MDGNLVYVAVHNKFSILFIAGSVGVLYRKGVVILAGSNICNLWTMTTLVSSQWVPLGRCV